MPHDLKNRLARLDRDQLEALVTRLVEASPDLVDLVHLPLPGEAQPLDPELLASRVTRILRGMGDDWQASYRAQFELLPLVSLADDLQRTGDAADARRVYRAIIDAILASYLDIRDEESEISNIVCDCCSGLGRLLDATESASERSAILSDLRAVFEWDRIRNGGYGMSEPIEDLFLHHTTSEERKDVIEWLLSARPRGDSREARWGRGAAGVLCLSLLGDDADPSAVEDVLRWAGLARFHIRRLLGQNRAAEAVKVLESASDDLCGCADLLVEAGLEEEAVRALLAHPKLLDDEERWVFHWLAGHGHEAKAVEDLAWQLNSFRHHATIGTWSKIREKAEALGRWAEVAPRLLAAVDDARVSVQPVRARALAAVGRIDDAMTVLAALPDSARTAARVSIARDAAPSRPDIARSLLEAAAERLSRRNTRAAREERERLRREIDALPASGQGA